MEFVCFVMNSIFILDYLILELQWCYYYDVYVIISRILNIWILFRIAWGISPVKSEWLVTDKGIVLSVNARDAVKRISIWRLPPILIIDLKRFSRLCFLSFYYLIDTVPFIYFFIIYVISNIFIYTINCTVVSELCFV